MEGPRLTEERLRYHLDCNQVMRERMCLAILPLLGPYTRVQPRRPKGGPDGGRDIEALYQGQLVVWGAVGFKNGGGAGAEARSEIRKKFKDDLSRALEENPQLKGFVFFTNVDLTPGDKEDLVAHAQGKGIQWIDVFDMERLRHVLDTPEGLIPRLQYLDIPMTPTEQVALVSKFGSQLQNAVTARFDRVERTLAEMQQFLDFQRPITRIDAHIDLHYDVASRLIGDEAILLVLHGLQGLGRSCSLLCVNEPGHPRAENSRIFKLTCWTNDHLNCELPLGRSSCAKPALIQCFAELTLRMVGHLARMVDCTMIDLEAFATPGIWALVKRVSVDANGYELFSAASDPDQGEASLVWPAEMDYPVKEHRWLAIIKRTSRNTFFAPLARSPRFAPLEHS